MKREALWFVLQKRYCFPPKLIHILVALHHDTRGAVRAYGRVCEELQIQIQNGVRQGDVLAPTLFNMFFDAIICTSLEKHLDHGLTVLFHPDAELVGSRKHIYTND